MAKKIYDPIKKKKDDVGNFEIYKKLIKLTLPPLKPYDFCIKQFFTRIIFTGII